MVWEEKRRSTSLLNGEHFSLSVYDYCVLHCTSTNYIVCTNDLCWCIYNVYNQSILSYFQYKISPFSQVNVLYRVQQYVIIWRQDKRYHAMFFFRETNILHVDAVSNIRLNSTSNTNCHTISQSLQKKIITLIMYLSVLILYIHVLFVIKIKVQFNMTFQGQLFYTIVHAFL